MNNIEYVDSSAYIRLQEKKLLKTADLERMADAPDKEELYRLLGQAAAYDFASLGEGDPERLLRRELRRAYEMAYGLSKQGELVDILACRYDFHNLKVAMKAHYWEGDADRPTIEASRLPPERLEAAVAREGEKHDLPQAYLDAVADCRRGFEAGGNPQEIDIVLDRAMYAYMLELCRELDCGFVTEYVRMGIDYLNLRTLVRVKNMQRGTAFLGRCLIPGGLCDTVAFLEAYSKPPGALSASFAFKHFGEQVRQGVEAMEKTGNYSGLERLLDNRLIEYTKQVKYLAFGPQVLFAFLVNKENEIRQIRVLLAGKNNRLDSGALRERLRENYA